VNNQALQRIAIAVVVLLALWGASRLLSSSGDRLTGEFHRPSVAADSADSVVIRGPSDTVQLRRSGPTRWTVNGYAASVGTVTEFFLALEDTTPPELVAQSAASYARLGVDSSGARRIQVWDGDKPVVDLLVSEQGPDYQSAYVRAPADSGVYAVRGALASVARKQQDDWRDRAVAILPDSIEAVELERGTRRSMLRKADGGWRLASAPADSAAVATLLSHLRTITASGFPSRAQRDSVFRGKVERRLTVRGGAGRAPMLALEFDSTEGGFWLRRVGLPTDSAYRMSTFEVDQLFPSDASLRAKR
jgi:hypothetical protein